MAATGSVSVTGTVDGLPQGSVTVGPLTISNAAASGTVTQLTLASGTNTITVPALATSIIIVFDSTSAVTKTLKGVAGDTGILLKPGGVNLLNVSAAGVASFVITAGAADTGLLTTIMFV